MNIRKKTLLSGALLATVGLPSSLSALSNNEVNSHVQVAFMWTPERESNYGGKNQVIANMRQSWGIANRAHDNGDTGMYFSYIPRDSAVNYNPSGNNNNIISDLRDNRVPGAHSWRNVTGGDVMGLNGQMSAAGLAYLGDERQYAVRFLTGNATAHELGHTFGCGHGGEGSSFSSGNGDRPYAGGWAFRNGNNQRLGTVMTGGQIMWYSTPNKTFQGRATGIADVKDNRRRILQTRIESSRVRNTRPEGGRSGGWWYIRGKYSNLYAGLQNQNSQNGTRLVQNDRRNNYSQWKFTNAGIGGGWMTIQNRGSGKVMDMSGVAQDRQHVHQWRNFNHLNQHAKLDHMDNGLVRIRFRNGGRTLANDGINANNFNPLVQWPWNGATTLQWYLEREHN